MPAASRKRCGCSSYCLRPTCRLRPKATSLALRKKLTLFRGSASFWIKEAHGAPQGQAPLPRQGAAERQTNPLLAVARRLRAGRKGASGGANGTAEEDGCAHCRVRKSTLTPVLSAKLCISRNTAPTLPGLSSRCTWLVISTAAKVDSDPRFRPAHGTCRATNRTNCPPGGLARSGRR